MKKKRKKMLILRNKRSSKAFNKEKTKTHKKTNKAFNHKSKNQYNLRKKLI